MPGAYTHLAIVALLTAGNELGRIGLGSEAKLALMDYPEFCSMGAISPDYPYLQLTGDSASAEHWANAMHHKYGTLTAGNILHVGIEGLRAASGEARSMGFAWLMGYASHVTADVTCHPMTNLLVGDYEADNQTPHRVSELNQDVYIFHSRLGRDVRKAEHIKNVVGSCSEPGNPRKAHPYIVGLWSEMLKRTFPGIHGRFPVNIHGWHNAVQAWLDNVAEELSFIPSRHIRKYLSDSGLAYPRLNEVNRKYIDALATPGGVMTFDQVFDMALANVGRVWKTMGDAVYGGTDDYMKSLGIWNLDTGQEVRGPKVMWEDAV